MNSRTIIDYDAPFDGGVELMLLFNSPQKLYWNELCNGRNEDSGGNDS